MIRTILAGVVLAWAGCAMGVEPGKAGGTITIDGVEAKVAFASSATEENLFDSSKRDLVIAVADRATDVSPDDRFEIASRIGGGELVAVIPRFDGNKLLNVGVAHKDSSSLSLLPGSWFQSTCTKDGTGRVKMAAKSFEGHTYAIDVEFNAKPYAAPAPEAEPVVEPDPAPAPEPAPVAASTGIDSKNGAALLISSLMTRDEAQALKLIKLGADPNGRDAYGIAVLNYAVMMCMPNVVQALVDRKADLKYERAPGMSILTEAGACPEAEKILRAAGAK